MPRTRRYPEMQQVEVTDPAELDALEDEWGPMLSPGGAAGRLGVKRQTVEILIKRGRIQSFAGPRLREEVLGITFDHGQAWVLVPVSEIERYAAEVGRRLPVLSD